MRLDDTQNAAPPTHEEMFQKLRVESVSLETDPWLPRSRHGHDVIEVFHRSRDDSYWRATYRQSFDGDIDDLRDGRAFIEQVEPHRVQIVVTQYKPVGMGRV